MGIKEEFLSIKSYDEYIERSNEFKGLDFDDVEIKSHQTKIINYDARNGLFHDALYPYPHKREPK